MSGSEIETPQIIWMPLSIHTNYTLAANNDYVIIYTQMITDTTTIRTS
jgi:hypothetical protein